MLRRAVLTCWAVSAVALWGQSQVQIDPKSQPAVDQLAAVAHAIKECPREATRERQWGKKPTEILRWYAGPPQNVVWDVVPGKSVRSPYLGFIEFVLRPDYWVPNEVKDKFEQSQESSSAELSKIQADLDPMKYRYEFDLGPSGLELTKMLRGRKPSNWLDESPDDTCWQKAARDLQGVPNPSAATQIAADVAATSIISFLGSAFLLRCDTEDVIRKESCKLWLTGVYSGLAAAGVIVDAAPKEVAKNNVVCLPESGLTDEQALVLVLKYVKDHPTDREQPTAALALSALQEAFPCKH